MVPFLSGRCGVKFLALKILNFELVKYYTSNLLCVPENFCMKVLGDVLYISVDGEIRGHDLKLNRPKDFSGNVINQI